MCDTKQVAQEKREIKSPMCKMSATEKERKTQSFSRLSVET